MVTTNFFRVTVPESDEYSIITELFWHFFLDVQFVTQGTLFRQVSRKKFDFQKNEKNKINEFSVKSRRWIIDRQLKNQQIIIFSLSFDGTTRAAGNHIFGAAPKNNDRIITRLVVVVISKNNSEISAADQNSIRLGKNMTLVTILLSLSECWLPC